MNKIVVNLKTGQHVTCTNPTADEVERWRHLLTTTIEGERLADHDIVILSSADGLDYIVTDQILTVSMVY